MTARCILIHILKEIMINRKITDKWIPSLEQGDKEVQEEYIFRLINYIEDLKKQLEIQKEEFQKALDEGFEEAYQMLKEHQQKIDELEKELEAKNA